MDLVIWVAAVVGVDLAVVREALAQVALKAHDLKWLEDGDHWAEVGDLVWILLVLAAAAELVLGE